MPNSLKKNYVQYLHLFKLQKMLQSQNKPNLIRSSTNTKVVLAPQMYMIYSVEMSILPKWERERERENRTKTAFYAYNTMTTACHPKLQWCQRWRVAIITAKSEVMNNWGNRSWWLTTNIASRKTQRKSEASGLETWAAISIDRYDRNSNNFAVLNYRCDKGKSHASFKSGTRQPLEEVTNTTTTETA